MAQKASCFAQKYFKALNPLPFPSTIKSKTNQSDRYERKMSETGGKM